ncbi:hypothetical protein [Rufibacter roseus]|uniref:Uncharacterized protein n=1 Tax=Rufibacter roseus TaxID=1567108 RepID=A0ABW2DP32_9BACT|nr:hypothetical protein [Rufibacter roseus]
MATEPWIKEQGLPHSSVLEKRKLGLAYKGKIGLRSGWFVLQLPLQPIEAEFEKVGDNEAGTGTDGTADGSLDKGLRLQETEKHRAHRAEHAAQDPTVHGV